MNSVSLPLLSKTQLRRKYDECFDSLATLLQELQLRLRSAIDEEAVRASIGYRVKSFDSYYRKLIALSRAARSPSVFVSDLVGIRVVCPFLEDVAKAERILKANFTVREVDRKGASFSVREFGYDSIHCLLETPRDLLESCQIAEPIDCEVQLRTILQDAWAEVEHELVYKSEFSPFDEPLQRKLAALNANLSLSDITFQEIREYQRRLNDELAARRTTFWQTVSRATHDGESPDPVDTDDDPGVFHVPDGIATADAKLSGDRGDTSSNLDALLLTGLQAHNAGDHQLAIETYSIIIDSCPKPHVRAVVYVHRGMAHFASDAYRDTVSDFTAALELEPENTRALFYRATVFRVLGDADRAESDFAKCLEIDPYHADCLYQRATMYSSLGKLDLALADCERALEFEPGSPRLEQLRRSIDAKRAYNDGPGLNH